MSAVSTENLARLKEILHQLDERLGGKDIQNRRLAKRLSLQTPLSMLLLTGISPTQVDAFSRNISPSGLGFVSKRMFRRYECLALPLNFPGLPGKLVLARVSFGRYLRSGLYEMGSEFLEAVANDKGKSRVPETWIAIANSTKLLSI